MLHPSGVLSPSLGPAGSSLLLRVRREGMSRQAAPSGKPAKKRRKHGMAQEPALGGHSAARAAKPRNKPADTKRRKVVPTLPPGGRAYAEIDAAVAAVSKGGGAWAFDSPPPRPRHRPTATPRPVTAVAGWRQRVSDFMSQIKTSIFGREELQAMASLGGASGKTWSIS